MDVGTNKGSYLWALSNEIGAFGLRKIGSPTLILTGSVHTGNQADTILEMGELRLENGSLTGIAKILVEPSATLSGFGSITGDAEVRGTLSVDGHLTAGGDVTLESGASLRFTDGGRLGVTGALDWKDPTNLATINLDSLGVYVLADYGSTTINSGLIDGSRYRVIYDGATISNGSDYRLGLINYGTQKELVLTSLPTGQKAAFWGTNGGGIWETNGAANWNTNYDTAVGAMERWAADSRVAVFGASGVTSGSVTVNGPVDASGLFFLTPGWTIAGDTVTLRDLDPYDAEDFAVIGVQAGSIAVDAPLTGDVGLHKSGAGTVKLNAANTYTGGTRISAGTLELGRPDAIPSAIAVESGAALRLDYNDAAAALSQAVSGEGRLEIASSARLDKANTFSGGTKLTGGTLSLGNGQALGHGGLEFLAGTLALDNGVSLDGDIVLHEPANAVSVDAGSAWLTGALSGFGGLAKTGAGVLRLNAASSYRSNTQITTGTLALGNVRAAGIGPAIEVAQGAALRLDYDNAQTPFPQTLTGDGELAITGRVLLDKANTFSGGTWLSGELHLAHANALSSGTVDFNNGRLVSGDSLTVSNDMTLSGYDNEFAVNGADLTLTGNLSGQGDLLKTRAGTLVLSGNNTYAGGTAIASGKLVAGSDTALGSGTVLMLGDVVLGFDGPRVLANQIALRDRPLFEVAEGNLALLNGVIAGSGELAKTGRGTLTLGGQNIYTGMTTVLDGTLALTGQGRISDQLALHNGAAFSTGGNAVQLSLLNVHQQADYVGDLHTAYGTMAFFVPPDVPLNGLTMLSVTGKADIANSRVAFDLGGRLRTDLQPGQTATLVRTGNGLSGEPLNRVFNGNLGITCEYTAGLTWDANNLYATISSVDVREESKALSTGFLSGTALLNQGGDVVAGKGMADAVKASRQAARLHDADRGLSAFGTVSGGWSKYKTGSSVEMSSLSVMTGLAWGGDLAPGWGTVGAFVEYGNGSYDTYNSFRSGSVDGDGDLSYTGGGLLARLEVAVNERHEKDHAGEETNRTDTFYLEASGRAGRLKTDYRNSDLRDPHSGRNGDYDSASLYYGAHVGAGYVWNVTENASLDIYGKFFWTHQKGDNVLLSNGDPVRFKGVDSRRLRLGGRALFRTDSAVSPYVGLAYEYEANGRAGATTYGRSIARPSLRGNTGIGEFGMTIKPSDTLPLSLDLGLQGYVGRREGVTGTMQIRYEF